jgi:hypothetical protein
MGGICKTHRRHEKPYKILVGKPKDKRPFGRSTREDNIKMDLKEVG